MKSKFTTSLIALSCLIVLPLSPSLAQQVKPSPSSATQTAANAKETQRTILFIGDSLTDGYGVKKTEAFPYLVGESLKAQGRDVKIVNAGISGSVTAGADRRLRFYLKIKPDILVLALGGNDALKGTPTAVIKKNLAQAIDLAQQNNIQVLLAGIRVFQNFGKDYSRELEAVYRELAKEKNVELVPFLLEDVALDKKLNLPDGIHPNAKGHEIVAKTILKGLEKLL